MKRILEVKKKIGNLSKNSKNPFFKSAYLDLTDLLNAVEPLLQEQGLVLLQPLRGDTVHSIIYDAEDGGCVESSHIKIPDSIKDPQKLGSAITYFRRYTLKSLLAIAEGDDDGNLASKPEPIKKELPNLTDVILQDVLKRGTVEELRALLNNFTVTKIQEKAIITRGKELQNGSK